MGKHNITNLTVTAVSRLDTADGMHQVPAAYQCYVHIAGSEADHADAGLGGKVSKPRNTPVTTPLTDNNLARDGRPA